MTEIMEILMSSLDPVPCGGDYRDEDNDEAEYGVLPPGPLIMTFTAYLLLNSEASFSHWQEGFSQYTPCKKRSRAPSDKCHPGGWAWKGLVHCLVLSWRNSFRRTIFKIIRVSVQTKLRDISFGAQFTRFFMIPGESILDDT
jgi:hypothetical protein